jgi:pimeloyl-ACP methyl ester carboxylesterase
MRDKRQKGLTRVFSVVASALAISTALISTLSAQTATNPPRATKSETRHALPTTSFYEISTPLPPAKAGALIRSEAFDDYDLSADMSALRILYHSRNASNQDVAASAVVLIPGGKSPAGGWPVIAWAHGFSGVGRLCAPSLMKNILNGPLLSMYLSLGYAVVATDYAGLGTYSRYAALDAESNATDVMYSIPAAHEATPLLSSKWIAMGNSQGAMAAIKVAERSDDPSYLGSIAISGVASPKDLYGKLAQKPDGMLAVLAYGIKTVFPEFKPSDMFTNEGIPIFEQVGSTCGIPGNAASSGPRMLRPDWEQNDSVQQFLSRNEVGDKSARGPLLVIAGAADTAIPASMTSEVVGQMCRQHDRVDFEEYPEVDAGTVLGASVRDQINWIQARFAGRPETSNCK